MLLSFVYFDGESLMIKNRSAERDGDGFRLAGDGPRYIFGGDVGSVVNCGGVDVAVGLDEDDAVKILKRFYISKYLEAKAVVDESDYKLHAIFAYQAKREKERELEKS